MINEFGRYYHADEVKHTIGPYGLLILGIPPNTNEEMVTLIYTVHVLERQII